MWIFVVVGLRDIYFGKIFEGFFVMFFSVGLMVFGEDCSGIEGVGCGYCGDGWCVNSKGWVDVFGV